MLARNRFSAAWTVAAGLACPLANAAQTAPPRNDVTIAAPTANAQDCNRRCLLEFLTQYTEALTDNKPATIAAARNVRVTGNGTVKKLGEHEVWGSPRRIPYRQAFVDPSTGAAVLLGVLTNDIKSRDNTANPQSPTEKWWFYAVRLKIEQHAVSEVEEVSYDGQLLDTKASSRSLPDRIFDTVLPAAERSTREQLINTAVGYFDAVSHRIDYHKVPWHPECQRLELFTFTVNAAMIPGSCGGEFQNPAFKWTVANMRIYIADVERGVVFGIANFTTPPEYPKNNGSVVFEVFKIQDGMIRHIEAVFRGNGQLHSGWGEGPGS